MAYPTVSKPYGLQPVNLIGGQVFAGATRYRRIASGYATAIFYGDLVKMDTDGTVVLANETTTGPSTGFAGVFLGCTYTDPTSKQLRFQQYYPGGITAPTGTYINAIIADDPDTLFKMAVVSGTTVVTGIQYQCSDIQLRPSRATALRESLTCFQLPSALRERLIVLSATTETCRTQQAHSFAQCAFPTSRASSR